MAFQLCTNLETAESYRSILLILTYLKQPNQRFLFEYHFCCRSAKPLSSAPYTSADTGLAQCQFFVHPNPAIAPKDVKRSRAGFEVIGVFNTGVTRLDDEVILLIPVAEQPINNQPGIAFTAVYDVAEADIITKIFSKDRPDNDFSDPRLIITPHETYTSPMLPFCRGGLQPFWRP
jgi:hypothetical protein